MRTKPIIVAVFFVLSLSIFSILAQPQPSAKSEVPSKNIQITLLGTAAGPPVRLNRYQVSTMVDAGGERLLFDCGRGTMLRLAEAGIPLGSVTKLFITHLHSDHIVDIPDLYLTPWASAREGQRKVPLEVWGPAGTRSMMDHLQQAFAFDIHIRRDVDEHFTGDGIKVVSHDIEQGVIYDHGGVKVTAFLVDHGPVKPAFGYRVDYAGHSVALSGDTRKSENLIHFTQEVDVLIHEAINPEELRSHATTLNRQQLEAVIAHHTTPEQAGEVFTQVKPRLAVYSHYPDSADLVSLTRKTYAGPLELGDDLMTINIGDKITVGQARQRETESRRENVLK
jgi:ribonuclease Z